MQDGILHGHTQAIGGQKYEQRHRNKKDRGRTGSKED